MGWGKERSQMEEGRHVGKETGNRRHGEWKRWKKVEWRMGNESSSAKIDIREWKKHESIFGLHHAPPLPAKGTWRWWKWRRGALRKREEWLGLRRAVERRRRRPGHGLPGRRRCHSLRAPPPDDDGRSRAYRDAGRLWKSGRMTGVERSGSRWLRMKGKEKGKDEDGANQERRTHHSERKGGKGR